MNDSSACPICGIKMANSYSSSSKIYFTGYEEKNIVSRTCNKSSHLVHMFSNTDTNKVELIKISLDADYSTYIYIDFIQNKTSILVYNSLTKLTNNIYVNKILDLDFPNLDLLKSKVKLYTTFI